MTERFLTPSKITAWLDCAHFLTLKRQVEDGLLEAPSGGMSAFARLLMDKGLEHETDCLEHYEQQGKSILRVSERLERESFAAWVTRVGHPYDDGWDVIYQMPLVHDGIRGVADFLIRVVDEHGVVTYEPVDAKLARREAKPGHVLQLCFYADALDAATGRRPGQVHLWLGSGEVESLAAQDFGAYWRRLRHQLRTVLDGPDGDDESSPEPCDHCGFCEFADLCDQHWRTQDALHYVAGLRAGDRTTLQLAGVPTLAGLAGCGDVVEGLGQERQARLVTQAFLQMQAREAEPSAPPPFVVIEPGDDLTWGRGFEQLPAPDDGDVFLDFEGHPFWRADQGLFFLLGLIEKDSSGQWGYRTWWAHTPEEEGAAALGLIDHLVARRAAHPGMHVYHYNHTERSSLQRLAETHAVGEVELAGLVDTGAFIDLLVVARNAVQVGTESYGLKHLERLTAYERGHDIDAGAGAVLEYEAYMSTQDAAAVVRIEAYNEDDVRATRALRDWLVEQRPVDLDWRDAQLEPDAGLPELDEQVSALHAYGPDTPEHLLGDVLGYWRREWLAHVGPLLALCESGDLLTEPAALGELICLGEVEMFGKKGQPVRPLMRFSLPEQDVSGFTGGDSVLFLTAEGFSFATIASLAGGVVDLTWSRKCEEAGAVPTAVVRTDWVSPNPKPQALSAFAAGVLDPSAGAPSPVGLALLRRELPVFLAGAGPANGLFTDDVDEMLSWVTQLDGSFVAVQGPPGTGKTYRGSHLVRTLLKAGKRVGITAMSHHAVDNLLEAVVDLYRSHGDLDELNAVKKVTKPETDGLEGVTYKTDNKAAAKLDYDLIAGTTWLFSGADMAAAPVDVLLVDEAGQLSLADALAACRSAGSVVLLGDPLQLPQVSQASHPGGGGSSVLQHVLGEHPTMSPERGVFIAETRRMHPDVCTFISQEVYEGRLSSHSSCGVQTTSAGTGLRWLRAQHTGCAIESPQEAQIVVDEITRLIGTPWTDQHGVEAPLTTSDFLVVAPYRAQVGLVREPLDADPRTRGVAVGTVDKFQGRQAAVVFFTMTTSTAADMPRGADFLFSRNRFNVAVSRARCLAYVVCTEELLNSRGRTVEDMRLISTICSFVEASTAPAV